MDERGWRFPLEADSARGRIRTLSYEDTIRQSVYLIVSTRKGERFLHPEFGCLVHDYLFQPIDYTTLKQVEDEVARAIRLWERRIADLKVRASSDPQMPHRINVEMSYYVPRLDAVLNQTYSLEDSYEP